MRVGLGVSFCCELQAVMQVPIRNVETINFGIFIIFSLIVYCCKGSKL